ncbi:MAG: hypothetical protein JXR42_03895 [Gammaproteobacteria bacterium]|nr:hypothetical protein [Gammaproteobacteria bacterium]
MALRKSNTLLLQISNYLARAADGVILFCGEDEGRDAFFHLVSLKLLNISGGDYLYGSNEIDIDSVEMVTQKARSLFGDQIKDLSRSYNRLDVHKKYYVKNNSVDNLFNSKYCRHIGQTKKIAKSVIKKHAKQLKILKNDVSSNRVKLAKLNIDVLYYLKVFSILAPLLAFAGAFVYEYLLLHQFSVNPIGYFTIIDYISAACNQLLRAVFFSIFMLLFMVTGRFDSFKRPSYLVEKENNFIGKAVFFVGAASVLGGIILQKNDLTFFGLFMIAATCLPYFFDKIVENSVRYSVIAMIVVTYFYSLTSAAYQEGDRIRKQHKNNVVFNWKGKMGGDGCSLTLITQNSRFCFLYSRLTKKTIIVPISRLEFITVQNDGGHFWR